jgi:NADPH2:quinone reductase
MKAMKADGFTGYGDLKLAEVPKPKLAEGQVLVRMAAAGVTPLEHTIFFGHFPPAKAPLVLGSEGAGVIKEGGDSQLPNGTRVMFTGAFGVFENGTYSQYLAVPKTNVCPIPDNISINEAASIPVAYNTAYMALHAAGFRAGKSVLSPAIGGSVANAVTQSAICHGRQACHFDDDESWQGRAGIKGRFLGSYRSYPGNH